MPKPKVILQLYPMLPARDRTDREHKRPIGRDADLYHKVLHEWLEVVKAADELGVWGISTIEHHFHSEGYEVGPNPGVLNAWWASHVTRARVGALGYVMAAQDPIRVAEETAILDHITNGRFFVGLARGYQSRWTNVLGQATNTVAALSDNSADDVRNRELFEERTQILLDAWARDSFRVDARSYKVPYPYETGVRGYPARNSARDAGCHGEVDEKGNVRSVSVVPAPYQKPHPPVFVALSSSADSIPFCARHGFRPTYFTRLERAVELSKIYYAEAQTHGLNFQWGERQNLVRWMHVAGSEREYEDKLARYDLDIFQNFYAPFFPQFTSSQTTDWIRSMKESGIFVGGTLDKLREEWSHIYKQLPAEYITLIWHYAQCPKDEVLFELDTFMNKVLPDLETGYAGS